jgi:hypothetical protein
MMPPKHNEHFEEFTDPTGLCSQQEIDAINEYRRTGKVPEIPYEELDWNNVGGIINEENPF